MTLENKVALTSDKKELQMLNNNNMEELIYTFFMFEKAALDLQMKKSDMICHFLELLSQDAWDCYDEIMVQRKKEGNQVQRGRCWIQIDEEGILEVLHQESRYERDDVKVN